MSDEELRRRNLVDLAVVVGHPLEPWQVASLTRLLAESPDDGRWSGSRTRGLSPSPSVQVRVEPSDRKFHGQPGRT